MIDNKKVLLILATIVAIVIGCRITQGLLMFPLAAFVLIAALTGRNGLALLGYLIFPIILFLNTSVIGTGGTAGLIARLAMMVMPLAFFIRGRTRRSQMFVPVGGLVIYLFCAGFSSAYGWFPMISYFKILNFGLFIFGMKFAVQNLNGSLKDINLIRAGFVALAAFIILGSLAAYPFPEIGYSMEIANARIWGAQGNDVDIGADLLASNKMVLFSGLLSHSQMLAPMTAMFVAWVLCDMLFVVGGFSIFHAAIVLASPVLLYLTRSRTALGSLFFALVLILFYAMPRTRIGILLRTKSRAMFLMLCGIAVCFAIVGEVRSNMMSKWFFKTDDLEGIDQTAERFISSRMGLVDSNMRDFHLNPLIGKGFQTTEDHIYKYKLGKISVVSAPVEKGVLPTMILGEGGLLGAAAFIIFLVMFYGFCTRNQLICTITLFSTFLVTNMGEASFFSPGGAGGMYWLISIAGGLCLDHVIRWRHQLPYPMV